MKLNSLINLVANLNKKGIVLTDEQFEIIFGFDSNDIDVLAKSNDANHLKILIYTLDKNCFDDTLERTIALTNIHSMPKENRDMLSKIFDILNYKKIELDESLGIFIYYISRINYSRLTDDSIINLIKTSHLMNDKKNLVKMAKIFAETNPKLAAKVATVIGSNSIREDKRLEVAKSLGEAYSEESFQLAYNAAVYMGQKDNVDKIASAIVNAKGLPQANLAKCVVANAMAKKNAEFVNITEEDLLCLIKRICSIPNQEFDNGERGQDSFYDIDPEKIKFSSLLADAENTKNNVEYSNKIVDLLLNNDGYISFEEMYRKNPEKALGALKKIGDSFNNLECRKNYLYVKKNSNN